MLEQRLRRWPNIIPTLEECTIFEGKPIHSWGQLFRDTHSNTVSWFANPTQNKEPGLWWNYQLIDVAQVYLELLCFGKLLLMGR